MLYNCIPSGAGLIIECAKCGAYMPCKIVTINGTRVPVCVGCLHRGD